MNSCDCGEVGRSAEALTAEQRRVLRIALALNATMFVVELAGGVLGDSSGLVADSLDMLADASAYSIGLVAMGRGARFKVRAATLSGSLLLALGLGTVASACYKLIHGSDPESLVMVATSALALFVNATVLKLLAKHRSGEVHLRATWIFTRADVVANLGVIMAGVFVLLVKSRVPDLLVGFAIGLYVMKEAVEILREAREAAERGPAGAVDGAGRPRRSSDEGVRAHSDD